MRRAPQLISRTAVRLTINRITSFKGAAPHDAWSSDHFAALPADRSSPALETDLASYSTNQKLPPPNLKSHGAVFSDCLWWWGLVCCGSTHATYASPTPPSAHTLRPDSSPPYNTQGRYPANFSTA